MSAIDTVDPLEVMEYLELIKNGAGDLTAALSVKWTPRRLRSLQADPEFRELVAEAKLMGIESVEEVVQSKARAGARWACEMVLFCHAADRGWRPPAQRHQHIHEGVASPDLVAAATELIRGRLAAGDMRALLPGNVIETTADDDPG